MEVVPGEPLRMLVRDAENRPIFEHVPVSPLMPAGWVTVDAALTAQAFAMLDVVRAVARIRSWELHGCGCGNCVGCLMRPARESAKRILRALGESEFQEGENP
jgi:hypothetical protein